MAAPEESLDEHRLFVQPEAPVSEDDEPGAVGGPTVEAPPVGVEISGLRRIQAAAIAGILGIALGLLTPIYLIFIVGAGLNASTASGGATAVAFTAVEVLFVALFAGVVLVLVSFGLYIAGFARLRRADARFGAPLGLAVVGLVGFLVLAGLVGLLFAILLQSLSCGGPGVATAGCVTLAASVPDPVTLVTELLLGLVLGLVGWIGLVLGLYRIGRRYGSTLTRVGAILYVVPLADVAAPILILIGTTGIVRKLRANPPAPPTLPESPPAPEEDATVSDEPPTP